MNQQRACKVQEPRRQAERGAGVVLEPCCFSPYVGVLKCKTEQDTSRAAGRQGSNAKWLFCFIVLFWFF